MTSGSQVAAIAPNFGFQCITQGACTGICTTSTILQKAFIRYQNLIRPPAKRWNPAGIQIPGATVCILNDSEELGPNTNETYTLTIEFSGNTYIEALSIFAAMRAMETLSQMVGINHTVNILPVNIYDYPRFSYRGLLVDSGRHFLPLSFLRHIIDGMVKNKLNVMHWHIVDDTSFPYCSEQFPKLCQNGSYAPEARYNATALRQFVAYARDRGVRIMPEIEVPGHNKWGNFAYPEIMGCPDVLDPTNPDTYKFLLTFLTELGTIFTDPYLFLGGDEVDATCFLQNPNIAAWLRNHNMNEYQLVQYFWVQLGINLFPYLNKTLSVWENDLHQIVSMNLPFRTVYNIYQNRTTADWFVQNSYAVVLSIAYSW